MPTETPKKKKSSKDSKSSKLKEDEGGTSKKIKSNAAEESGKANKKESASEKQRVQFENADFEAGILFSKYDKSGMGALTAEDFKKIWREANRPVRTPVIPEVSSNSDLLFEAGLVFSRYESEDGKLSKEAFEKIIKKFPQILSNRGGAVDPPLENSTQYKLQEIETTIPKEIVSGHMLTHYDETAGVPLGRSAIDQHKAMGHMVGTLAESYKARYDKLRHLLTSKLLPRREHILQLRRQLQNSSAEVSAAKKSIEKETMGDAEQILDRLRDIESSRQSSIRQQVLVLDEELEGIERAVRRVELANDAADGKGPTGVLVTSVTSSVAPVQSFPVPRATKMVELIQEYADIASSIEHLASKQLSIKVDFSADDFPRETSKRLDMIARCEKYSHALNVKDQMLWTVTEERNQLKQSLQEEQELCQEYAEEVSKWAEISHNMSMQMQHMKQQLAMAENRTNRLTSLLRDHNIYFLDSDVEEEPLSPS